MVAVPSIPETPLGRPTGTLGTLKPAVSSEMARLGGAQVAASGKALLEAGEAQAKQAQELFERIGAVQLLEAQNKLLEEVNRLTLDPEVGYQSKKGRAAIEGENGQPLSIAYRSKLEARAQELAGTLSAPALREQFDLRAAAILQDFSTRAQQHEMQELRAHGISMASSAAALAADQLLGAARLRDADIAPAVDAAENTIDAAVMEQGRLEGWSATEVRARQLIAKSKAHRAALLDAIESGELGYAHAYLARYGDRLTAEDVLDVRRKFDAEAEEQVAMEVADAVTATPAFAAAARPTSAAGTLVAAHDVILNIETSPSWSADQRRTAVSSAGAVGIGQMLLPTAREAAAMAGVPWDEKRYREDIEYQKLLSRTYFESRVRARRGDLLLAAADYHSGMGNVNDAIRAARERGGSWRDYLGPEGREYVRRFEASVFGRGGSTSTPSRSAVAASASLTERLEAARRHPAVAGNPRLLRKAQEEVQRRYAAEQESERQMREDAFTAAVDLTLSGQRVPSNIRSQLSGSQLITLSQLAERQRKDAAGSGESSPEALQQVSLMTSEQLRRLPKEEHAKLRAAMTASDYEQHVLVRMRPPATSDVTAVPMDAFNMHFNNALRIVGVDPATKVPDELQRIGVMRMAVLSAAQEKQRLIGRQLNAQELRELVSSSVLYNERADTANIIRRNSSFLGGDASDTPIYGAERFVRFGPKRSIPDNVRDGIVVQLARQLGRRPTEEEVQVAYAMALARRGAGLPPVSSPDTKR